MRDNRFMSLVQKFVDWITEVRVCDICQKRIKFKIYIEHSTPHKTGPSGMGGAGVESCRTLCLDHGLPVIAEHLRSYAGLKVFAEIGEEKHSISMFYLPEDLIHHDYPEPAKSILLRYFAVLQKPENAAKVLFLPLGAYQCQERMVFLEDKGFEVISTESLIDHIDKKTRFLEQKYSRGEYKFVVPHGSGGVWIFSFV